MTVPIQHTPHINSTFPLCHLRDQTFCILSNTPKLPLRSRRSQRQIQSRGKCLPTCSEPFILVSPV
jgi:hypothetical protein